jgi:hypothetical protein
MSANIYYVYAYLREDGTPYYIGKGKGKRAREPHYNNVGNITPKTKERIIILHKDLTESESFELEKTEISKYGRKDIGTGILRNLTDGGEGLSGYRAPESEKYKYSKPGSLNGMYGRKHSEELKEASRVRRAETNRKRKWYNNGVESRFLISPPDSGWMLGRINQKPTTDGGKWYNNGKVAIVSRTPPVEEGWRLGMLPKKRN